MLHCGIYGVSSNIFPIDQLQYSSTFVIFNFLTGKYTWTEEFLTGLTPWTFPVNGIQQSNNLHASFVTPWIDLYAVFTSWDIHQTASNNLHSLERTERFYWKRRSYIHIPVKRQEPRRRRLGTCCRFPCFRNDEMTQPRRSWYFNSVGHLWCFGLLIF